MTVLAGNALAGVPSALDVERIETLVQDAHVRIERIISTGQASQPGFWYDQDWAEFVMLLSGAADVFIEGEATPRSLHQGDYLLLPAHCRHRVERTSSQPPAIWLAIHMPGSRSSVTPGSPPALPRGVTSEGR